MMQCRLVLHHFLPQQCMFHHVWVTVNHCPLLMQSLPLMVDASVLDRFNMPKSCRFRFPVNNDFVARVIDELKRG